MSELIKDFKKALDMSKRVYNNKAMEQKDNEGKVIYSDEQAIKALCSKVFSENGEINSIEDLRSFNKLIVETANFEAQAKFEQIVNAVSDFKTVNTYDQAVYYTVPLRTQTTVQLSASATGVDYVRIPSRQKKVPAHPRKRQFGVQYQISEMVSDPVNAFRSAVNSVVEAKLKFIFNEIMKLARNGKTTGKIPTSQFIDVANLTVSAFRKTESSLIRVGKNTRPVLIADTNFISSLAEKQATEGLGNGGLTLNTLPWLTDEMRMSLLRDLTFDMVSRSFAIATDNPFIDETNSKVDLDPSEALLLAGGEGSPFKITEYGTMRTTQELPQIEDETVRLKIDYVIDVTLLLGNRLAYIRDTQITI